MSVFLLNQAQSFKRCICNSSTWTEYCTAWLGVLQQKTIILWRYHASCNNYNVTSYSFRQLGIQGRQQCFMTCCLGWYPNDVNVWIQSLQCYLFRRLLLSRSKTFVSWYILSEQSWLYLNKLTWKSGPISTSKPKSEKGVRAFCQN